MHTNPETILPPNKQTAAVYLVKATEILSDHIHQLFRYHLNGTSVQDIHSLLQHSVFIQSFTHQYKRIRSILFSGDKESQRKFLVDGIKACDYLERIFKINASLQLLEEQDSKIHTHHIAHYSRNVLVQVMSAIDAVRYSLFEIEKTVKIKEIYQKLEGISQWTEISRNIITSLEIFQDCKDFEVIAATDAVETLIFDNQENVNIVKMDLNDISPHTQPNETNILDDYYKIKLHVKRIGEVLANMREPSSNIETINQIDELTHSSINLKDKLIFVPVSQPKTKLEKDIENYQKVIKWLAESQESTYQHVPTT